MGSFRMTALAVVGAGVWLAGAGIASAATCTTIPNGTPGNGDDNTYILTPADAAECYTGNDTNTIDANFELFGETGWILGDKEGDESGGDNYVFFTDPPAQNASSGDWTISNPNNLPFENIALSLKAGNSFGVFDITALSGDWQSVFHGLSHASLYYRLGDDNGGPNGEIPLPASALLLLGGIGGLGALRAARRKA